MISNSFNSLHSLSKEENTVDFFIKTLAMSEYDFRSILYGLYVSIHSPICLLLSHHSEGGWVAIVYYCVNNSIKKILNKQ
ncbi:unnamed protein product [Blepharisma stoltei]|uniref:Uncharacterized protein n=1 Tax=Blepharisma stoltei TaxID=1481888 RepID=A0AAU9IED9_9CILI|nr:unnamed protein product [Blepharisma stoltei]